MEEVSFLTDHKRDPRIVTMRDPIGRIARDQALIAKNAARLTETVSKSESAATSDRQPEVRTAAKK